MKTLAMKNLQITQFGNPILRAKAGTLPAAFLKTTAFRNLTKQMFQTMRRVKGVGLAAPQINKPLRLAVIGVPIGRSDGRSNFKRIIVNPKITWHSKSKILDFEGCLSFPDARGAVPRWSAIQVEYINEKGVKIKEKHVGFLARVFQHEIDHLNGFLYVDRMTNMKTLMTHREFMKRMVK